MKPSEALSIKSDPSSAQMEGIPSFLAIHDLRLDSALFLGAILVFFSGVSLYSRFVRKCPPPPSANFSVQFSIIGLILLAVDSLFGNAMQHRILIQACSDLIVLFCIANFLIYLIIDVYVYYRTKREVPSFLRDLITLFVYIVFAIISLRTVFHIEISSILTTTTVLTATIAFAMQSTLANVLSGFSIQSDQNLQKGTWIAVKEKDVVGKIINVGFRYTSLKTFDNSIVMVPNNIIMQNVVTTLGGGKDAVPTLISLDVSLGYELPPEKARAIINRVLKSDPGIIHDPPPFVRILTLGESSIDYRLRFSLHDYGMREEVKDRLHSRVWYAITREGYDFPYPHREIVTVTSKMAPFAVKHEGIREELRRIEVFGILNEQQQEYLTEHARLKVFGPGELVVRQDEIGESLFVVIRGELRVYQNNAPVGSLCAGEFFGEMSLLTGELRKATVTAEQEVWLLEVTKAVLEPVIRENPDIMDILSSVLAERECLNTEVQKSLVRNKETMTRKEEYLRKLKCFFGI